MATSTKTRKAETVMLENTQEQSSLWQNLFEQHPAMKLLIDPDTSVIEDANQAACKFFELTKKELRSIPPPWSIDVEEESLRRGLKNASEGKQAHFVGSRCSANGEIRTVEAWISPLRIGKKNLLYAIAFDVTERIAQEKVIREKNVALERQNRSLAEKNIAIQEIAVQVEQSRNRAIVSFAENTVNTLLPIIARLKACHLNAAALRLVDTLERAVREIASSDNSRQESSLQGLTMREREICNLIRNGLSSKEIAGILGISYRSVENHRYTVRRKLGFDRSINLGTYLSNIL